MTTHQPKSRADIVQALQSLSYQMLDVATDMDYCIGFEKELAHHAFDLANASVAVQAWADDMAKKVKQK